MLHRPQLKDHEKWLLSPVQLVKFDRISFLPLKLLKVKKLELSTVDINFIKSLLNLLISSKNLLNSLKTFVQKI